MIALVAPLLAPLVSWPWHTHLLDWLHLGGAL